MRLGFILSEGETPVSQVRSFDGNYSQYEEDRRARLDHDADTPHSIKYKPLVRA